MTRAVSDTMLATLSNYWQVYEQVIDFSYEVQKFPEMTPQTQKSPRIQLLLSNMVICKTLLHERVHQIPPSDLIGSKLESEDLFRSIRKEWDAIQSVFDIKIEPFILL